MNINEMTIGQFKELSAIFNTNNKLEESPFIGKVVIVRTYSAGVHIGTLLEKNGMNTLLRDARRVWRWRGAFTLSEVSVKGIDTGSRISCAVDMIELTESVEIIPVTDTALQSILSYEE